MNFLRAFLVLLSSAGFLLAEDTSAKKIPAGSLAVTSKDKDADDATGANNVVLGRELISVTRSIEEVVRIQQQVLSVKAEIGSFATDSLLNQSSDELEIGPILEDAKSTNERLKTHKQDFDRLSEEANSVAEKVGKATDANTQDVANHTNELSAMQSKIDEALEQNFNLRKEIEKDLEKARSIEDDLIRSESRIERRIESLGYLRRRVSSLSEEATLSASLEGIGEIRESRGNSSGIAFSEEMPSPRYIPVTEFGPAVAAAASTTLLSGEVQWLNSSLKKLAANIQQAEQDNSELETSLQKSKERITKFQTKEKTLQSEAAEVDQAAQKILETLGSRISSLRDQRAKHERDLQERDAALNQFEINRLLVYAVYGMVASIVALFVLLRWYPASLTGLIVEQRVFVEVLSMGFLLVTVIILGSGKLIMGEGLAGLLGTIAGYIFAKKATELLASDRQGATAGAIERQLVDAYLKSSEAEVSLNALKTKYGPTPTEEQKADIAKAQAAFEAESARAEKLTASLDVMAKLRQRPNDLATGGR